MSSSSFDAGLSTEQMPMKVSWTTGAYCVPAARIVKMDLCGAALKKLVWLGLVSVTCVCLFLHDKEYVFLS